MATKILSVIILLLFFGSDSRSQNLFYANSVNLNSINKYLNNGIREDSGVNLSGKSKVAKVSFGGVFIAPTIGISFPFGQLATYSRSGFLYGAKLEIAFSRLYPFIFGFIYEGQKFGGNANFLNNNPNLSQFDTKINSLGGSLDIILNKYIRSDFTTPILTFEIKYASVTRIMNPDVPIEGIPGDQSMLTYTAGLGFTIYVLDIVSKYTFAGDYSSLSFQTKFHFPIFKF